MQRLLGALLTAFVALGQGVPGYLHGTVVDLHGAVIPGAQVMVESSEFRCETRANETGHFDCKLPAGQYRVKATDYGFLAYQRSPVTIKAGNHVFVTLSTIPGPERGLFVEEGGARELVGTPIPVKHRSETIDGDLSVLIRFMTSQESATQIHYYGPYLMLTSDALAIYADEIDCSIPIRTCTAIGHVSFELNKERLEGSSMVLDLQTRTLALTREPRVSRAF